MDWFDITLRWYLVTLLATLAFLPITMGVFRKVTDRGASFARPMAALLMVWPVWFLSGITGGALPWTGLALWLSLILVGGGSWILTLRAKSITPDVWKHFLIAEAGFLAAFAVFLWFRGYGPATSWQEKPSDLMMLSSLMMSDSIPPQDAWLAGEPINYYYLGYAIWGGFGKMIGAAPSVVYNLALISTFATAFTVAVGLVANVIGRYHSIWAARVGGVIAALAVLVIGNPWSTWQALTNPESIASGNYWGGIGWNASRIMRDSGDPNYGYNPITEFPSFSFVLGDLHPHVLALPYTLMALALCWVLIRLGRVREADSLIRRDGARIAIAGLFIGSLYAMNSWDFPTYLLLAMLALALGTVGRDLRERTIAGAILVGTSVAAWIPFYLTFEAPAAPMDSRLADAIGNIPVLGGVLGSIGVYQNDKTDIGEFFGMFGFQYVILLVLILVEAWRRREDRMLAVARARGLEWEPDQAILTAAFVTAVLCFIGALFLDAPLLVLCGLPVIVIWLMLERDIRLTPANTALVLFALALTLLLVPEFFYISDIYSGSRMNTVFKVYYQVWTLTSVAGAIAAVSIWQSRRHWSLTRYGLPVAMAGLLLIGMAYPVYGGQQWLDWRSPDRTWDGLDGLAYLRQGAEGPYSGEHAAIEWLLENAGPDDVVLATGGGEWDYSVGRVASGTGIPTIIGWSGHEDQWHLGQEGFTTERAKRVRDIEALYAGPPDTELLDRYGVTYIYIGPTETDGAWLRAENREGYGPTGPFPAVRTDAYPGEGWTLVFEQDGSRLYKRD